MATEDNKDLSRRFLEELWNEKNVSIIDELLADTYVDHTPPLMPSSEVEPQGREALKQLFNQLQNHFSDIHVSIEDQTAEEDKVATQVTWECTDKSDNLSTTVMGVGIDRIDSSKIVENWNTLDVLYRLLNLLEGPDVPHLRPPGPPRVRCDRNHPCPSGFKCLSGRCQRA